MIKKLSKMLIIVLVIFGCSLYTLGVSAVEEPIIEEETQPSDLAIWVEEHIIEIIVGTASGSSVFITGIGLIVAWLRKKTGEMQTERQQTNQTQLMATDQMKQVQTLIDVKFTALMTGFMTRLGLNEETMTKVLASMETFKQGVNDKIALLESGQATTNEILRLAISSDTNLVRLGIAETVNRLISAPTTADTPIIETKEM